jgi:hypothetical protein
MIYAFPLSQIESRSNFLKGKAFTTKNVRFVKLSKCVTDFTIAFLSSRWSKNIYGMSNLKSG